MLFKFHARKQSLSDKEFNNMMIAGTKFLACFINMFMKKIFGTCIFFMVWGCSNNANTNNAQNDSTHVTYDASKADTTSIPNGVTHSTPISVDTAAYRVPDSTHK